MTFSRATTAGWAAIGAVALCSPALAQTAQSDETFQTRKIDISPTLTVTYDSNVAQSDSQVAALRHLKPEDVRSDPSIALDIVLPIGREALFLNGSVGYDFYARNKVLNRERLDLTGGVAAPHLLSCSDKLTGDYSRHQSELQDLAGIQGSALTATKNTREIESVALDVSCGRAIGLKPTLSVSETVSNNSAPQFKTLDNHSLNVSGGLGYAQPAIGVLSLYGAYSNTSYGNPFTLPSPPFPAHLTLDNGFETYSGGLRFERHVGSRIQGSVALAYTSLSPASTLNPGFSGFTYGLDVSYVATSLTLHMTADRSTQPANLIGAAYYIGDKYMLEATYARGSRLTFNLGGLLDDRHYQGVGGQAATLISQEKRYSAYGSARLVLNRRAHLSLDVRHVWQDTNVPEYSFRELQAGVTIGATF